MPIEFRCTKCGRLLRTGDDTAGQQAQCPECGGLSTIPTPGRPTPGPAEVPAGSPGDASTAGAGEAENPYQSPGPYEPASRYEAVADPLAAQRVAGPATALLLVAVVSLCFAAIAIFVQVVQWTLLPLHNRPDFMPFAIPPAAVISGHVVGIVVAVIVLLGAIKMKNLENYGLAMTAAIIAVIPCIAPCCIVPLPFGIWALIVLSDDRVKAAFRS